MRIAVLSDLHANKPALEAVHEDCSPVDATICAGDVIGYNPWPTECVDFLRKREIPTVIGNHDRVLVEGHNFRGNRMAQAGIDFARQTLSDRDKEWLANLPTERRLFDDRVKLVHDHPTRRDHYTYPSEFTHELLEDEQVLIMGHTHVQHAEQYEDGIVMNPGSVGQPRDDDPRAAYAVLDLDRLTVTNHRVDYDIESVVTAVQEAGLPARTADRLRVGR